MWKQLQRSALPADGWRAPDERGAGAPARLVAPLVLASASPRRAAILARAGFEFAVRPARVPEAAVPVDCEPAAHAVATAAAKAFAAARERPEAIVLGADTVVVLDGALLGKPRDAADAVDTLRALLGREHRVVTGVAVAAPAGAARAAVETVVRFREYTEREIEAYVASGRPMDKAGSYGIQDRPFSPASAIKGCYMNVVGLPMCMVAQLLERISARAEGNGSMRAACAGCGAERPEVWQTV